MMETQIETTVFSSIYLDREGNVVEVRDKDNNVREIVAGADFGPARVGGKAPSGKTITKVDTIEIVSVENEGHHDDPCWIRDSRGNWRCVCAPALC
jgi:hypothetical protein